LSVALPQSQQPSLIKSNTICYKDLTLREDEMVLFNFCGAALPIDCAG